MCDVCTFLTILNIVQSSHDRMMKIKGFFQTFDSQKCAQFVSL